MMQKFEKDDRLAMMS